VTWHAVDADGLDLATGRPPRPPGPTGPASALASSPVAAWPVSVVAGDGRTLDLAAALGPGGGRVAALLDALAAGPPSPDEDPGRVEAMARATPAGEVGLPLAVVPLHEGVEAAAQVDPAWLSVVDGRRAAARRSLEEEGRGVEADAALHVAMLLATERFDPADDADVAAHVASGARLWLLTGAVVSALAGADPDPFRAWGALVAAGWWPVGPSGGRLVLSEPA
jgi:hypothetical protein